MKTNLYIEFTNSLNFITLEKSGNRKLQKHQLARRHRSIDWRWQSRLLKWFD